MATLPEIATNIVNKTVIKLNEDCSRTIFFVGSKSVGKSTLLYNFLEKNDTPKETLVLEYSFGRKTSTKQGLEKMICHVWEYGGKLELLRNVLTSVPIHSKNLFVIMIDLSKLKAIWNTLQICVEGIKEHSARSNCWELIFIGGKYDLFKNYDTEVKKLICTTIRSVALIYNAHVLFYSSKESQLLRRTKDVLHSAGFGCGVIIKEKNLNYNKPLAIPKGSDSWESIGIPAATMEQVKISHVTRIPLEVETKDTVSTELQKNHPEPILDSLVALKYEDLRNLDSYDRSINDYLMCL